MAHESSSHEAEFERSATQRRKSLAGEVFSFARSNRKWWMWPILIILLLLVLFVVVTSTGAGALIYPLF